MNPYHAEYPTMTLEKAPLDEIVITANQMQNVWLDATLRQMLDDGIAAERISIHRYIGSTEVAIAVDGVPTHRHEITFKT